MRGESQVINIFFSIMLCASFFAIFSFVEETTVANIFLPLQIFSASNQMELKGERAPEEVFRNNSRSLDEIILKFLKQKK